VASPTDILRSAFEQASSDVNKTIITNPDVANRIESVCRSVGNGACVRVLLACSLAKIHKPSVDIRKPYTEIGDVDAYGGRGYDEKYLSSFLREHGLPCNSTTGFLTPAFRNIATTLTPELNMVGRPAHIYKAFLQVLADVYEGKVSAEDVLAETIRRLLIIKNEQLEHMNAWIAKLKASASTIPLSSEDIVTLIEQHLKSPNSSRLPVLVVAAVYDAAKEYLGERALPLEAHNAADKQTGSLGDIHITLVGDDNVVTVYEMKAKRVIQNDIDIALQKIDHRIDNYIIITTEDIDEQVKKYASNVYAQTRGIEFVVLDCLGFIRHFLHLFHRIRMQFLEAYQGLLLAEPESAVRQPLKESFLALRIAAETAYISDEGVSEPDIL
jgi:hypothetical protein